MVSPDGLHLYTKSAAGIHRYLRDQVTGELDHLGVTPTLALASWLAFSPDGAFLYAMNGQEVQVWARDAGTGALTLVESEPTLPSGEASAIAVSPDGAHVYAAHDEPDFLQDPELGRLFAFARNGVTGELTPVEVEPNGRNGVFGPGQIDALAVSPDGRYLFAAGVDTGESSDDFDDVSTLTIFRRDPDSGLLALLQTSHEGENQTSVRSVLPSPDGAHVYRVGVAGLPTAIVYAPGFGCSEAPLAGCRTSEKAKVSFDSSLLPTKERASFSWSNGEATTAGEFDPGTDDHFALCAYESDPGAVHVFTALAPAGEDCCSKLHNPQKPCWKVAAKATKLKDPFRTPDGLGTLTLKPGADGFASVVASAQGVHVRPPDMPLGLPLRVQLQGANGVCWEAVFGAATTNEPGRFRAKNP